MRRLTVEEERIVLGAFDEILPGASQVFEDEDLYEHRGEIFAGSMDFQKLPEEIQQRVETMGLRIGSLQGGIFAMDLQGARVFQRTDRTVRLRDKALRAFLYGRNISIDALLDRIKLPPGEVVLVADARWEVVGLATWTADKVDALEHIMDVGLYLRDEDAAADVDGVEDAPDAEPVGTAA